MDYFWNRISRSLELKSKFNCGVHACTEWTGAREHGTYGKKSVEWPDGTKCIERTHRLAYMLSVKILKNDLPHVNEHGERLDVSHICHNPICIRPQHLILETHTINMERMGCKMRGICTKGHFPYCLL